MKPYISNLIDTEIGDAEAFLVIDHGTIATGYPVDPTRIRTLERSWLARRSLSALTANLLNATDKRGEADSALLVFACALAATRGEVKALQNRGLIPVCVVERGGAAAWYGVEPACRASTVH
jgi:hypothetical protein